MIKKGLIIFSIGLLVVLTITGCGGEKPKTTETPVKLTEKPISKPTKEEPFPKTEPMGDEIIDISALTTDELNQMGFLKDIHFDFDKYNIKPDEARILDENARWLKMHPTVEIIIEGHCDERGTNEYNIALGDRRARAAYNYIVALGIDLSRMRIVSYGEEMPIDPGHNEIAWEKNRRAHFLIVAK
jgi:peptidoglycan-associated lipoprotein